MAINSLKNKMKNYYYKSLFRYLSVYIRPDNSVIEVNPISGRALGFFSHIRFLSINRTQPDFADRDHMCSIQEARRIPPDYFLLNGNIQYEGDVHKVLSELYTACSAKTRIAVVYYRSLWKPLIKLAGAIGLSEKTPERNWVSHEDMASFLLLSDFEPVAVNNRIICPFYIPIISGFLNRFCAPLPFFRLFCMTSVLIARPVLKRRGRPLSVSVIVPARNESGSIENIVKRIPRMGPDDELIFVEGGSKDNTWDKIIEVQHKFSGQKQIKAIRQAGKGKADAVREGFNAASKDILMILDGDMTVPPESLVLFYDAAVRDKGEFLNGSRFVYPMEKRSMRFCNLIGNKFFALAFSYVLGQKFKDTLCGTKVILKECYPALEKNRLFFGELDQFGDYDLILGAARLGLKMVEIPIPYKARIYGNTNLRRWKQGFLFFLILLSAARRMKFV